MMPKIQIKEHKLFICFHDWKSVKVTTGLRMRGVTERRFCPHCKTHQIKKIIYGRGWATTGSTKESIDAIMKELNL